MKRKKVMVSSHEIESKIYLIRGQKVMLDSDLAELYEVETRVLNQAVNRNMKRFPADFIFQLNQKELGRKKKSAVCIHGAWSSDAVEHT